MKLYYAKGSCSLAIRILIHELNLACEFESVNLRTKQTETGRDFLTINSKGSVPALAINAEDVLTENAVIQQYLADTNNAEQLLPKTGNMKRYRILEWQNFVSTELHKGCSPLFNPNISTEMKEEVIKPNLKNKLNFVNKHLEHNNYLSGQHFTLPDAYLFVILSWLENLAINIQDWPALANYFAEIKKRKSVQQALTEEGLI